MTTRLKHTIHILEQVSFSKDLFIKEVSKAFEQLLPYEIEELKEWIKNFTQNKEEFREVLVYV